ncbi:MAG: hypothetical protein AABW72_02175 [archaeon]
MNNKAQVSFDYLITVAFAIIFTMAIIAVVAVLTNITMGALAKIAELRENTIASVIQ